MSVVNIQDVQPPSQHQIQRQSQRQGQRRITGRRKPFGMHVPQKTAPSTEELVAHGKRQLCQEEIQTSTTNLVKTSLSHIARSEEHAKRFKKEIDQSQAIPALLQEHLGWVSKMPSTAQLITLVGEKWLRTRIA